MGFTLIYRRYINVNLHREDGPAIEWSDGSKKWYLNGQELSEEEFIKITQSKKNK